MVMTVVHVCELKYLRELHKGLVGDRLVHVPGYKFSLWDQ